MSNKDGSTHRHQEGGLAYYGTGDHVRMGIDTTDPGVTGPGGNIIGTTLEDLSDEELEARGYTLSESFKQLRRERAAAREKE